MNCNNIRFEDYICTRTYIINTPTYFGEDETTFVDHLLELALKKVVTYSVNKIETTCNIEIKYKPKQKTVRKFTSRIRTIRTG